MPVAPIAITIAIIIISKIIKKFLSLWRFFGLSISFSFSVGFNTSAGCSLPVGDDFLI